MAPIAKKPRVIRMNKQVLLQNQADAFAQKFHHPSVSVRRASQVLNIKKNVIEPLNEPMTTNRRLSNPQAQRHSYFSEPYPAAVMQSNTGKSNGSPVDLHKIDRPSFYGDTSTEENKSKRISRPSSTSGPLPSSFYNSSLTMHHILKLGGDDDDEKKNKRKKRRRGGYFKISRCCCYCLILSVLALILLGAIIAAIIMILKQPKTTSTTTTSTTSTTSTSTTTTTTTETTTTTTETTTTTSETTTTSDTTTTVTYSSCASSRFWNQTGTLVAGTNTSTVDDPRCVYIDANDTMYICAHDIGYVQLWNVGDANRTRITTNYGDHIDYVAFDPDGFMYANSHNNDVVRQYPPGDPNGTIYAGSGSGVTGTLEYPMGIAVDDDFNLYIADRDAELILKREPNGTSLISVINTNNIVSQLGALALPHHSSNQIYMSDQGKNSVYLWTFNATTPSAAFTQVNDGTVLDGPRGIKLDSADNLYVADEKNSRIVMFCANSTTGVVIANLTDKPRDLAFDSQFNLYVALDSKQIMKYSII